MKLVLSAGNNPKLAMIAQNYGIGIGARLPGRYYVERLDFADCHWKNFRYEPWYDAIERARPLTAVLPDILEPSDLDRTLQIASNVAHLVSDALIIVPKCDVFSDLPRTVGNKPVWIGYSVPSRYGASPLPLWMYQGWPIHLLGGSPTQQFELMYYLDVRQADGTAIISAAKHGTYWDRYWRGTPRHSHRIEELVEISLSYMLKYQTQKKSILTN